MSMTTAHQTLRVGTLNVRSLGGRLAGVLDLATTGQLDILCLQETRVSDDSWSAVNGACNKHGWKLFPGSQDVNACGAVSGGILIISRWPAEALPIPTRVTTPARAMALKVYRPRQRPLLLINLYLHANNSTQAKQLLLSIFEWVAELGEEAIILGDFNMERHVWPISSALATGRWYSCDEQVSGDHIGIGTHRNANDQYTGSVIDFGLATPRVLITSRTQTVGVADHDAVVYDIAVLDKPSAAWRLPAGEPLLEGPIPDNMWEKAWQQSSNDFQKCLAEGELQSAWVILSNCAERLMHPKGHASRAERRGPQQMASPPSSKAPTFQTLLERKLRRFARRVQEFQRSFLPELAHKLHRDAIQLHPSLAEFALGDRSLAVAALQLADKEAAEASNRRVTAWKEEVQENVVKLSKWVQQKTPVSQCSPQFNDPILPGEKAACEAEAWRRHWNPDILPDITEVSNMCLSIGIPTDPISSDHISLDGIDLYRVAAKTKGKAPGMDAWTTAHLCQLPLTFWNLLASLWNTCLSCGCVPSSWKNIRIALLPKASGGFRPLAIASVMWRICMSTVLKKIRGWIDSWALPQLCGGLPGKSIMDVHEWLAEDISLAKQRRQDLVGCKADIRKCFDSVCPKAALCVWKWLGAPTALCQLLDNFYDNQQRWFAWQGYFSPHPIVARRGLLQGCPASPALMNALMVVWVRVVQRQEPRASLSVYLDDRTIWKRGANGIQIVVNAMRAGAEVDTVLGFELHPDKLASFTTRSNLLPQLALHQSTVGEASNKFTLLGIQYNLERAGECVNDEPISRIIAQRCRRIRVAARHLGTRKALLLQLVIPLFAWTGAFHHYHGNVLKQWTMTIEAAIWGRKPPPGRSRFLFWNSLGVPSLHPGFVLLFVAAKAEWNRQCRLAIGLPAASISCNRWQAVLKAWKWHVDNIGIWNTSAGKLKPGWMSSAALKKAAVAAWIRQMWEQDTKTEGALPPHKIPVLQFQQHVATELNFYGRRVLTGAAVDGRVVQRIGHPMQCECGEEMPTREHFTFFCSANPWHLCLKTGVERRLLLSLIDAPPVIPFEDMVADPQLVAFLQQFDHSQLPTLGSDGSCIIATGSEQWQRASWAVAAHLGPAVNGLVPGFEQTPAAGERFALLQALLAASAANRPVKLLSDNQAVCLRLERGLNYGNWSGDLPCFWHLVSTLVIAGTSCVWIPSHGKQPLWRPPAGWLDVQLCRQLNARADAAASDISAQFRPGIEAYLVQQAEARRWSSGAFQAQLGRSQRFWQVLLAHDPRHEQGGEED